MYEDKAAFVVVASYRSVSGNPVRFKALGMPYKTPCALIDIEVGPHNLCCFARLRRSLKQLDLQCFICTVKNFKELLKMRGLSNCYCWMEFYPSAQIQAVGCHSYSHSYTGKCVFFIIQRNYVICLRQTWETNYQNGWYGD